MPSTIMHLAFGKMVYEGLKDIIKDRDMFLMGNLLPDESLVKNNSHYRKKASTSDYKIPDLNIAKDRLLDVSNPLKLGAFSHLYYDHFFFESFFLPLFDFRNGIVTKISSQEKWRQEEFFTRKVFYSAYGELNHLFMGDGYVTYDDILRLPKILPISGVEELDARREINWQDELLSFLNLKTEYKGNILNYGETVFSMKKIALELVEFLKNNI